MMNEFKTLELVVKAKWFAMILSGEKKEEYREIKPYWGARLCAASTDGVPPFRRFDFVRLRNGYQKDSPAILIKCEGISIGKPRQEWSDGESLGQETFIIRLGEIVAVDNLKKSVEVMWQQTINKCKCGEKGNIGICPYDKDLFGEEHFCYCCDSCSEECAAEI